MRRTAMVLSGSACCVYGLTFTSHFYGARRTVGYVPFNSETLVTGKLFEDIREAVFKLADPALYDTVVITNLCVPTASGVPLQLLPKDINGVRIIGIDVPGFGVPTHAEAKDVLAGAMFKYARRRDPPRQARLRRRATGRSYMPTITLLGEMFPADPVGIGHDARTHGIGRWSRRAHARVARTVYAAFDCAAVAAIHPFYTASVREFEAAGRDPSSVPHRWAATAPQPGSMPSAMRAASQPKRSAPPRTDHPAHDQGRARPGSHQVDGSPSPATRAPSCWSRVCWSRAARTSATSARPARARAGPTQIAIGSRPGASWSGFAHRSSTISQRSTSFVPTSRSARRRWCRRPRKWPSPACISPT